MKIRHIRKRAHKRMHISRAFMISVKQLVTKIAECHDRFERHLQAAMGDTSAFKVERFRP